MKSKRIAIASRFGVIFLGLIVSAAGRAAAVDVQEASAIASIIQPHDAAGEMTFPATLERALEQDRAAGRRRAAQASFRLSVIAAERSDYGSARTFIDEAVQLNPLDIDFLRTAAAIAFRSGEYDRAETYQERALDLVRSEPDRNALEIATILDELGVVYLARGRYTDAEKLSRQSLEIREQASGKMHPSLAGGLNDLASFAMKDRRFEEAEQLLRRAVDILGASLGMDHADTAMAMHNLADYYANRARFAEAETLYRSALLVWKTAPEPDRLELAAILNELGSYYRSRNRLNEAEPQFDLVLNLLDDDFGHDHPHIRTARVALENLKQVRDKRDRAREFSQKLFDELQSQLSSLEREN